MNPPIERGPLPVILTVKDMQAEAADWIRAWNERDLPAILAKFSPVATFSSPIATTVVGAPILNGREELLAYWTAALGSIVHLRFDLIDVVCDTAAQSMAIQYRAELDDRQQLACETARFLNGWKIAGAAFYGATLARVWPQHR